MATPPRFVAEYEVSSWTTTTSPKTVSVDVAVGDIIVVCAGAPVGATAFGTPSGGGLTYTLQASNGAAGQSRSAIWTAVATSDQTFTLSLTWAGAAAWGFTVMRFSAHGGVGGANANHSPDGSQPSLTLTASGDDSALCVVNVDFNELDGATRTYRTAGVGAESELVYQRVVGACTFYMWYHSDAGAAGSKTVGMTVPNIQDASTSAVEILGLPNNEPPWGAPFMRMPGPGPFARVIGASLPPLVYAVPLAGAVQFDAPGEFYTASLSLGAQTSYTVACWLRIEPDPNTFHGPLQIKNAAGTDYLALATQSDGTTMQAWNESTNLGGPNLTPASWYFFAVTRTGTTSVLYWAPDGTPTLTAVALTDIGSVPFDAIGIGHGEGTADWFRGAVTGVKSWTGVALSQAQLETEMTQKLPVITTNLVAGWPLEGVNDTNDVWTGAFHLSGGSGATTTNGPNVPRGTLGSGVSVGIGQASETSVSRPVSSSKTKAFTGITETDVSRPVSSAKTAAVGRATDTSVSRGLSFSKASSVGRPSESSTSRSITTSKTSAVGRVTSTDSSRTLQFTRSATLGRSVQTDNSRTLTSSKSKAVLRATETTVSRSITDILAILRVAESDMSRPLARSKAATVLRATETDAARLTVALRTLSVGRSAETNVARSVSRAKALTAGRATESDSSRALALSKFRAISRASETDTARALSWTKALALVRVSETDTASSLTGGISTGLSRSIDTEVARSLGRAKLYPALGRSTEADSGRSVGVSKAAQVGRAQEAESARAMARAKVAALLRANESNASRALSGLKVVMVARAAEANIAGVLTVPTTGFIGGWGVEMGLD